MIVGRVEEYRSTATIVVNMKKSHPKNVVYAVICSFSHYYSSGGGLFLAGIVAATVVVDMKKTHPKEFTLLHVTVATMIVLWGVVLGGWVL